MRVGGGVTRMCEEGVFVRYYGWYSCGCHTATTFYNVMCTFAVISYSFKTCNRLIGP